MDLLRLAYRVSKSKRVGDGATGPGRFRTKCSSFRCNSACNEAGKWRRRCGRCKGSPRCRARGYASRRVPVCAPDMKWCSGHDRHGWNAYRAREPVSEPCRRASTKPPARRTERLSCRTSAMTLVCARVPAASPRCTSGYRTGTLQSGRSEEGCRRPPARAAELPLQGRHVKGTSGQALRRLAGCSAVGRV